MQQCDVKRRETSIRTGYRLMTIRLISPLIASTFFFLMPLVHAATAASLTVSEATIRNAVIHNRLIMPMPDGSEFNMAVTSSTKAGFIKLDGASDNQVVHLVLVGDLAYGSIRRDGLTYQVRANKVILDESAKYPAPANDAIQVPFVNGDSAGQNPKDASAGSSRVPIDFLVFLSQYEVAKNGPNGARAVALANLAVLNEVFTNSGISGASGEILGFLPYTSSSTTVSSEFPAFSANNDVQAQRQLFGADVATLLLPWTHTESVCGLGYEYSISYTSSQNAPYAFNVVAEGQSADGYICSDYSFAHETGHNMGANHDRAHVAGTNPSFDYAYGYTCGKVQADIMAANYLSLPAAYIYSSPSIYFNGIVCGVAANSVDANGNATSADNTTAVNNNYDTVAAYRAPAAPDGTVGLSTATLSPAVGSTSLDFTLTHDTTSAVSVEVGAVPDSAGPSKDAAQPGVDYQDYAQRVSFAQGQTTATGTLTLTPGAKGSGPVDLKLVVRYPQGTAVGVQSQTEVTIPAHPSLVSVGNTTVSEVQPKAVVNLSRVDGTGDNPITYSVQAIPASSTPPAGYVAAIDGVDFMSTSGSLDIAPGQTAASVSVPILTSGQIGTARAFQIVFSGQLVNDDGSATSSKTIFVELTPYTGTIAFSSSAVSVDETQKAVSLTIVRTGEIDFALNIPYSIQPSSSGPSSAAGDSAGIGPTTGSVTLPIGATSVSIPVQVNDGAYFHSGNRDYAAAMQGPFVQTTPAYVTVQTATPTVSFVAPPAAIPGQPFTFTWSSQYADTCTAGGDWTGTQNTTGSYTISAPQTGVQTFVLTCANSVSSKAGTLSVNVQAPSAGGGGGALGPISLLFLMVSAFVSRMHHERLSKTRHAATSNANARL